MEEVRTRIAPSPTGENLHIGNVYTALVNYVFSHKNKGKFIVRIEDTDRTRLVPGSMERIIASLDWLGLVYDEGPEKGGPYGPYQQSERLGLYKKYAQELIKNGHAYYCFCTPERLTRLREEQQANKQPTLYDGYCTKYNPEEAEKMGQSKPYVIRLKVPEDGTTEFTDAVRGKISFENRLIDDQVLIKSDGYPTYHLAVVVDDHLMKISHVIRAEEWISSTPKHVLIYKFLGWDLPVFAHGPILRNPDKSKLSKRKNPVWVSWYREQGFLPEAILNYLALMGWSMPDGREIFSLEDMELEFELEDMKAVGPAFDLKKLEWMNGEYIRQMQNSKLKDHIWKYVGKAYSEELIGKTVPLIKERIKKFAEYLPLCGFFFKIPESYEVDLAGKKEIFIRSEQSLGQISDWTASAIGEILQKTARSMNIKNSDFFMALRVAVTGKKISPPLNESMEILGKDEVLKRLQKVSS